MIRPTRFTFPVGRLVAVLTAGLLMAGAAFAQPLVYGPEYAATVKRGGTIVEPVFSEFTTLNPYLNTSATELNILGMFGGPGFIYRDWAGTRSFKNAAGEWMTSFALEVEELEAERDYIITIREGWEWSDGTPMTMDDVVAGRIIHGDPETQSNTFACTVVGDDPVAYEVLDERRIRITLPSAQVNALASKDCGLVPAHIFMPVYEQGGGAAVAGLWGTATDPAQIISGGPYKLVEYRPGERIVMERNPNYTFVQAADGTPLPGPDRWIVTLAADTNAILAQVLTGEASFWNPTTLDQVRAIQQAVTNRQIPGRLYTNLSPSNSTDFVTYNFNNTDPCKAAMFRDSRFRRAISMMLDRDAMVEGAVGGLGFQGLDWITASNAPFDPSFMGEMPYDPEQGVRILRSIGFTQLGNDGVLRNPTTGCRVEFDLQYNTGNNRRAQLALVFADSVADWGVKVNPREVSVEIWSNSITGTTMPRTVDYDAQIWGLTGGDVDNPDGENVFRVAVNLNAWNKDPENVASWELLMDQLTVQMGDALDLDDRLAIYQERALLMRENLPVTPLIATSFHFYENLSNLWPVEIMDANTIQAGYRPGNFRVALMAP
jgi:peptide/nickel transport system substrate-binding protein